MLVRLLVELDVFSVFPIMNWQRKIQYYLILSAMILINEVITQYYYLK